MAVARRGWLFIRVILRGTIGEKWRAAHRPAGVKYRRARQYMARYRRRQCQHEAAYLSIKRRPDHRWSRYASAMQNLDIYTK